MNTSSLLRSRIFGPGTNFSQYFDSSFSPETGGRAFIDNQRPSSVLKKYLGTYVVHDICVLPLYSGTRFPLCNGHGIGSGSWRLTMSAFYFLFPSTGWPYGPILPTLPRPNHNDILGIRYLKDYVQLKTQPTPNRFTVT